MPGRPGCFGRPAIVYPPWARQTISLGVRLLQLFPPQQAEICPRWGSFGVWRSSELRPVEVTPLIRDHPALTEAATILARRWKVLA